MQAEYVVLAEVYGTELFVPKSVQEMQKHIFESYETNSTQKDLPIAFGWHNCVGNTISLN